MIVGRNSINVGVVRHVPSSWGSRGSNNKVKIGKAVHETLDVLKLRLVWSVFDDSGARSIRNFA